MFLVIKKDSVKSISAFYTVFLAFATPIILYFNVVFKLLPYVALALQYFSFYYQYFVGSNVMMLIADFVFILTENKYDTLYQYLTYLASNL